MNSVDVLADRLEMVGEEQHVGCVRDEAVASIDHLLEPVRFGLDDGCTYTMDMIGKMFSVSRERVRQIEGEALRKLQQPHCMRKLEAFLDDDPVPVAAIARCG